MNSIVFITANHNRGTSSRFILSTAIGFEELGWQVFWIGLPATSISLIPNCKTDFSYQDCTVELLKHADTIFIDTARFFIDGNDIWKYSELFNFLNLEQKIFIYD